MASYSSSSVIQVSGSPEVPNLFEKVLIKQFFAKLNILACTPSKVRAKAQLLSCCFAVKL